MVEVITHIVPLEPTFELRLHRTPLEGAHGPAAVGSGALSACQALPTLACCLAPSSSCPTRSARLCMASAAWSARQSGASLQPCRHQQLTSAHMCCLGLQLLPVASTPGDNPTGWPSSLSAMCLVGMRVWAPAAPARRFRPRVPLAPCSLAPECHHREAAAIPNINLKVSESLPSPWRCAQALPRAV